MGVVKCLLLLRSILVRYSTRTFASLQTSFLSKFLLHSLTKFSRLRKVYENWFPTTDGVSPVLGLNESASVPHDLGAGSHFFTELAGSFYDTEEDDEHSSSSCLSEIHSLPDFLPVDDNRNCIALLAPLTSQTTAHAQQTPHLRIQDWLSQHLIDTPYFMHGRPSFPSKRSLKFRNTTSICSRAALSSLSASQEPASRLFSVEDLKPGGRQIQPVLLLPAPPFLPESLDIGLFCEKGTRLRNEDVAFAMRLSDHVDAVDTFSQAVCCGLFDGHGGAEVAEHLAEFLPQTLSLRSHAIKSQGVQEMAAILQSTESALYERYQREWLPLDRDPGSTALLTMVMDEELLVANVGDCRLLLISEAKDSMGNRTAFVRRATCDHHCGRNQKEAQRVRNAGGLVDEDGCVGSVLEVSRSLGDFLSKEELGPGIIIPDPEVYSWKLGPQDLMAVSVSDGISAVMDDTEICNMLCTLLNDKKRCNDPAYAARELASFAAFAKSSSDNCSAVLVLLKIGPPPMPARRRLFGRS